MTAVSLLASLPDRLPPDLVGMLTLTASGGGTTSGRAVAMSTERLKDDFSGDQTTALEKIIIYLWPAGLAFPPDAGQLALWGGVTYLIQVPLESITLGDGSVALYRLTLALP